MNKQNLYLGIDIGGTKTAVIVGTAEAEVVWREQFATEVECGPEKCFEKMKATIATALQQGPVKSMGVSCGGPLDSKKGLILSPPNLPGWDAVPITQMLSDWFDLPAYLMNDANAGAVAEWRFGAGKGVENMIFLTFGTGLGAGLILNGRLYSGTNDLAGEVGHLRIAADGPEGYGKAGSFEGYCSGPGLVRLAQARIPSVPRNSRALLSAAGHSEKMTARHITDLALGGDVFCRNIVAECGMYFGRGLALLVDMFNPERIVVGSMGVRLGELLFEPARRELRREGLELAVGVCEIVPAQLAERIGDVAALSVAMTGE